MLPNDASKRGRGSSPTAESTAILRGSGVSSVTGTASKVSENSAATCSQYGRASRKRRRYIVQVLIETDVGVTRHVPHRNIFGTALGSSRPVKSRTSASSVPMLELVVLRRERTSHRFAEWPQSSHRPSRRGQEAFGESVQRPPCFEERDASSSHGLQPSRPLGRRLTRRRTSRKLHGSRSPAAGPR